MMEERFCSRYSWGWFGVNSNRLLGHDSAEVFGWSCIRYRLIEQILAWFQISFAFIPFVWVNDLIWLSHTFQMGWFNHQLNISPKKIQKTRHFLQLSSKKSLDITINIFPKNVRNEAKASAPARENHGHSGSVLDPVLTAKMSQLVAKKEGARGFYLLFVPKRAKKLTTENRAYHSPKCHWPIFEHFSSCRFWVAIIAHFWSFSLHFGAMRRFSCSGVEAVVQGGVSEWHTPP